MASLLDKLDELDDGTLLLPQLREAYLKIFVRAFADASDQLDLELAFDVENERVQDVLEGLLLRAKSIAETTKDSVRTLIGRAAEEGWSIDQLADEIRAASATSQARALLIARTETARGYSLGSQIAWKQSGVVDRQEWLVSAPCTLCQPLDGKVVKLGQAFAPGIYVPGDTHPGCRCGLAPRVSE